MLGLEVRVQFPGIEEIVFDCVAGTRDVRALQSADRVDELELHVEWQARGNAVRVEWLSRCANRTTLSSMDGQYLGPTPSISPEYIGERCSAPRMMSWVFSEVCVIQQLTCSG